MLQKKKDKWRRYLTKDKLAGRNNRTSSCNKPESSSISRSCTKKLSSPEGIQGCREDNSLLLLKLQNSVQEGNRFLGGKMKRIPLVVKYLYHAHWNRSNVESLGICQWVRVIKIKYSLLGQHGIMLFFKNCAIVYLEYLTENIASNCSV